MSTTIDSSTWPAYSKIDAELEALLPHLPPPTSFADYPSAPALRDSFTAQITQLVTAGLITLPDWTGYRKEEFQIPVRDGRMLRAIVYGPKAEEGVLQGPVYVYFHGGGWTFGMPEYGEGIAEGLVKELGVSVVSVGYRLGPENVFPAAVEDASDAVRWVAEHGNSIGVDASKGLILGGTSAGSNLAAVAAHVAVDEKLEPTVTGVVLSSATLCHPEARPEEFRKHSYSWEEHKEGMILDRRGMEWFYDQYKPDPRSPLASPLLWETHKGQPATYIQVMGMDPMRDDSLIYEQLLKDAGTSVKVDMYAGIPHGGPDFLPMHSVAKKALVDLKEGMEWILRQT